MGALLTTFAEAASPFAFTALPNLTGLYDATNAASITQSSNLVSAWNDGSGKGNHLLQATNARKPLLVASGLNGLPALEGRHDGSTASQLACADNLTLDYTRFHVMTLAQRVTDTGSNEMLLGKYDQVNTRREWFQLLTGDAPRTGASSNGATGTLVSAQMATTVAVGTPFIIESYYDGTNIGTALNGGTPTTTALGSIFQGIAPLTMFSHDTTFLDGAACRIAVSFFCTDVLSAGARAAAVAKLKSMGGIA